MDRGELVRKGVQVKPEMQDELCREENSPGNAVNWKRLASNDWIEFPSVQKRHD